MHDNVLQLFQSAEVGITSLKNILLVPSIILSSPPYISASAMVSKSPKGSTKNMDKNKKEIMVIFFSFLKLNS